MSWRQHFTSYLPYSRPPKRLDEAVSRVTSVQNTTWHSVLSGRAALGREGERIFVDRPKSRCILLDVRVCLIAVSHFLCNYFSAMRR
jgi:hypothetical protein